MCIRDSLPATADIGDDGSQYLVLFGFWAVPQYAAGPDDVGEPGQWAGWVPGPRGAGVAPYRGEGGHPRQGQVELNLAVALRQVCRVGLDASRPGPERLNVNAVSPVSRVSPVAVSYTHL